MNLRALPWLFGRVSALLRAPTAAIDPKSAHRTSAHDVCLALAAQDRKLTKIFSGAGGHGNAGPILSSQAHWRRTVHAPVAVSLIVSLVALLSGCSQSSSPAEIPTGVAPTIASFTASPSTLAPGGSATLAWNVTGAVSIAIEPGIGTVTGSSTTVTPSATTTYILTATNASGSATVSATVSVTAGTLVTIQVTPSVISIAQGTRQQFAATGLYADASTQDLTAQVSWSSSSTSVATISNAAGSQGLASGVGVGLTTVSASLGGVTGSTQLAVTAASLVTIQVTPSVISIAQGTQQQLAATGLYTDTSTQDLTAQVSWSSSSTSVATISNAAGSQGLASGVGVGTATVSASLGGITGSTDISVTAAALVSIQVAPTEPSIALGTRQQFAATGVFSDSSTQDLTAQVSWSSSSLSVATVSDAAGSQGLASGVGVGSTTISASLGGVTGSTQLAVTAATLTSIAVLPVDPAAPMGTTLNFTAVGTYSDGSTQDVTTRATWTTSDSLVAAVSNAVGSQGLVTMVSTGATNVSAAFDGQTDSSALTVTSAVLVSISVTPAIVSISRKATQQFAATGTYSDGSTLDITNRVTWSSSSTAVATVSNAAGTQGLATGLSLGTATITAYLSGNSGSASLTVSDATLTSIALAPAGPSVAKGYKVQFRATGTFSDGTSRDLTATVTWSSSNTSVATISNAGGTRGQASVLAVGTATISARYASISGSTLLTGTSATLSSIAVTPAPLTLAIGQTQRMTATGTFSDASTLDITAQVVWKSSNKHVASVTPQALVRGVKKGTATVSATRVGVIGTAQITVQ